MRTEALALLFASLSVAKANAEEIFIAEKAFSRPYDLTRALAADIEIRLSVGQKACIASARTTIQSALDATFAKLGKGMQSTIVKPKLPGAHGAAWGCLCGAYNCPIWVYRTSEGKPERILETSGTSLTVVDRQDQDMARLLVDSGSAGHQSETLYGWNGRTYAVLRSKSVVLGQGGRLDRKAEQTLVGFRQNVVR